MRTIEVDKEVYGWLESQIQGFSDTPNTVLRRLLGIGTGTTAHPRLPEALSVSSRNVRSKAPKTNLKELVRAKMLSEGQLLYLRDYQAKPVHGVHAVIRGNNLEYRGRLYSMSALTRELMKDQGYANDSYRGPQFWYTADGKSIKDIWDTYLRESK